MSLLVRDVKRLLAAGIKAEYERTHDPRLEDADAVCAASLTEICRQAAAPAWNAGVKHVLDYPEIAVMYDPADASTNPWRRAGEMPDDSHVESCFVVEKPDDRSHCSPEYDTYEEACNSLRYLEPGEYEIRKRFRVNSELEA